MLTTCVVLYLVLLISLLWVAYHRTLFQKYYTLSKSLSSIGFIVVATVALLRGGSKQIFFYLLPCLILCMCGDILLGLANTHRNAFTKLFVSGTCAFFAGHILYCYAFTKLRTADYSITLVEYLLPIALILAVFACSKNQKFHLDKGKKPLIFLYAGVVGLMCSKAIHFAYTQNFSRTGALIMLGAILFLISDMLILFLYFYENPPKAFRALNLGTYYIGMLLIALSI